MTRVLWLAVAEARGHLMRARLMRELLQENGVAVIFGARLASSLFALPRDYPGYEGGLRGSLARTAVCALSALDWVGSMGAGARVFANSDKAGPVLSYHDDGDRLADTIQAFQSV